MVRRLKKKKIEEEDGDSSAVPVTHDTLLQWESEHEEDSVVVLSDVWLDKPETLDRLRTLFTGDNACDTD